ncbi:hypothetical protein D7X33_13410 [Butyricicoccus sp. 1XD8-22]|nr:hypothetical protein D7X33_13410 [Butyricicoccus sp. 1XD8-22]
MANSAFRPLECAVFVRLLSAPRRKNRFLKASAASSARTGIGVKQPAAPLLERVSFFKNMPYPFCQPRSALGTA